jgi:hypothetical protein
MSRRDSSRPSRRAPDASSHLTNQSCTGRHPRLDRARRHPRRGSAR